MAFDLMDGNQQDVALLTARQTRTISSLGLLALATRFLEDRLEGVSLLNDLGNGLTRTVESQVELHATVGEDPRSGKVSKPVESLDYIVNSIDIPFAPVVSANDEIRELQRKLLTVVCAPTEIAQSALDWFDSQGEKQNLAGHLWGHKSFRVYLRRLATSYYMSIVLPKDSPERCVVKVTRQEVIEGAHLRNPGEFGDSLRVRNYKSSFLAVLTYGRAGVSSIAQSLGVRPMTTFFEAHQSVDAQSYHLDLSSPKGLKTRSLTFLIRPPDGGKLLKVSRAEARRRREVRIRREMGDAPVSFYPNGPNDHSRIHASVRPVPLGYSIFVRWRQVPQATGWLMVACPITLAFALLQTLIALPHLMNTDSSETFRGVASAFAQLGSSDTFTQTRAGFLLGFMALALTLLLRSGEARVTQRLLLCPRALLGLSSVCLVAASSTFFVRTPDFLSKGNWGFWAGLGVSWIAAGVLFLIWGQSVGVVRRPLNRIRRCALWLDKLIFVQVPSSGASQKAPRKVGWKVW